MQYFLAFALFLYMYKSESMSKSSYPFFLLNLGLLFFQVMFNTLEEIRVLFYILASRNNLVGAVMQLIIGRTYFRSYDRLFYCMQIRIAKISQYYKSMIFSSQSKQYISTEFHIRAHSITTQTGRGGGGQQKVHKGLVVIVHLYS